MRTLVLQLARFGDIYQSWPTLRALHRLDPSGQIDVLVRERFLGALQGLEGVRARVFPTATLLKPILDHEDTDGALKLVEILLEELRVQKYDRIINLSFSPLSSFLAEAIAKPEAILSGYTRHSDGYLAIPDDTSAYFYAQVGVDRSNRYHLCDVFAAVAEVSLQDEDFRPPAGHVEQERQQITVHLGASQQHKIYPPELWVEALRELTRGTQYPIVLIGSSQERGMADTVMQQVHSPLLVNKVGETDLAGLFDELLSSKLFIGGDSGPMQMTMLTETPVLNLSCASVNFWETGPLSAGSRVLFAPEMSGIDARSVAQEARAMLAGQVPTGPCYVRGSWRENFCGYGVDTTDFRWSLVQALYTGTPFPEASATANLGFQRLLEVAELALSHLEIWNEAEPSSSARIFEAVDEMIVQIGSLCPDVVPVVNWFQTQRLRLPPASLEQTLVDTKRLFTELYTVCAVYHKPDNHAASRDEAIRLGGVCVPELRECDFAVVEGEFQKLMAALQDLARHSTKVGEQPWSEILGRLSLALEQRDFIELADQLEFELQPALATMVF